MRSIDRRKYLRCCATPEAILMHPAVLTYALTQVFEVYRWCVSLRRHWRISRHRDAIACNQRT